MIYHNIDIDKFAKHIEKISNNYHLFICGVGASSDIFFEWFKKKNIRIDGIVDKNKSGKQVNGTNVIDYNDLNNTELTYFFISSILYRDDIISSLHEIGIGDNKIIAFYDVKTKEPIFYDIYSSIIEDSDKTDFSRIKNIFLGKRAFIIGNGPSLKISDLNKLNNEITFAMNSITCVYSKTQWRPTYYLMSDSAALKKQLQNRKKYDNSKTQCLYGINSLLYLKKKDIQNALFYKVFWERIESRDSLVKFSENPSEGLYDAGTTLYLAYQFAAYMGVSEIYLLGVDFDFMNVIRSDGTKEKLENHNVHPNFMNNELDNGNDNVYYVDAIYCMHRSAKKYCDAHGIKIFNATRGGKLEVFPRVNFDSLFN